MYPSGQWRGCYAYRSGGRQAMSPLVLRFHDGHIEGEGKDVVGPFTFEGRYDDQGMVRMVKQYLGGHQVIYQGAYDGEGAISGEWLIPHCGSGPFALAPSVGRPPADAPIESL